MDLIEELKTLTAKLDQAGIAYALCGGLALAVYARPRATLDIDLLIESEALAKVKEAAAACGFDLAGSPMVFHGGKVKIHRLTKIDPQSGESLMLDLLLVTPETRHAWEERQTVDWDGGALTVVSPQGLILLKSFRQSGQDADDIAYLRSIADGT